MICSPYFFKNQTLYILWENADDNTISWKAAIVSLF